MTPPAQGPLLYLSSPLGFSELTRSFLYTELQPLLVAQGWRVLNPWVLNRDVDRELAAVHKRKTAAAQLVATRKLTHTIGETNLAAIDAAAELLAVLDGVDVDSGVAAEVGYAYAAGKRVHGLVTDRRLTSAVDTTFCNAILQYIIEASGGRSFAGLRALQRAWRPKPGGAVMTSVPRSA